MGYYSTYEVAAYNVTEDEAQAIANYLHDADDTLEYDEWDCSHVWYRTNDLTKWYNHDEDMIELFKMYPNAIFVLCGDGEQYDDHWRSVYFNGHADTKFLPFVYPEPDNPDIVWALQSMNIKI